jgi:hypothetical protein
VPPIFVNYIRRAILSPISKQIKKTDYILKITNKDDYVLDSLVHFNSFKLFRKDTDFFWVNLWDLIPAYRKFENYRFNIYELIKNKKPKVIDIPSLECCTFFKQSLSKITKKIIEKNYKKSKYYNNILIRNDVEEV